MAYSHMQVISPLDMCLDFAAKGRETGDHMWEDETGIPFLIDKYHNKDPPNMDWRLGQSHFSVSLYYY
jgi:hypothetical protein